MQYLKHPDTGVSTHSRLKAAGTGKGLMSRAIASFNTQPPEGGWLQALIVPIDDTGFNTQPPEGGWFPA